MTQPANPLVAARVDTTTRFSGVGIAETVDMLIDGVKNGSWVDGSLGGVGTVAEAAVWVLDPVGALVTAGFGWVVEHVQPLSEALDWLAGDPDQVTANAHTWRNVGVQHADVVDLYTRAVRSQITDWDGAAAAAYRTQAWEATELNLGLAKAAEGMAVIVEMTGSLVSLARTLVRDLIGELVSILVARLPLWTIEAVGTLGIGALYVEAQVTALVAKWGARITRLLKALTTSLRNLLPAVRKLDEIIETIARLLGRRSSAAQPRTLVSGGVMKSRRPRDGDYEALWQWAEDAYTNIRSADDTAAVTENLGQARRLDGSTGFSLTELQQIRQHVFFDEHLVDSFDGSPARPQRFDANEDMAEAWLRLRSGNACLRTPCCSNTSSPSCGTSSRTQQPRTVKRIRQQTRWPTGRRRSRPQHAKTSTSHGGKYEMAMMITARKIAEDTTQVRYQYGLTEQYDHVMTIDCGTGQLLDAPRNDRLAGKIYMKIKREWEATGQFPQGAIYAS